MAVVIISSGDYIFVILKGKKKSPSGQKSKTQNNVKAKIQDKEANLRQCQGKDSGQVGLRTMSKRNFRTRKHI